jgi:hypothetical protein
MSKEISERDKERLVEYALVEKMLADRRWAGKATGNYVNVNRLKKIIRPDLRGYVDEALDSLEKSGFVREYKGGETVALNPEKNTEITDAINRYRSRYERLHRKLGMHHEH